MPDKFTAHVIGDNVVPPSGSGATGTLTATLDNGTLTWQGQYNGLGEVTLAAYYRGEDGQNGSKQIEIPDPATGKSALNASQQTDLKSNLWYIQIATVPYPTGEIRGQLYLDVSPPAGGSGRKLHRRNEQK